MFKEIITTNKRSLGQYNVFKPVCHSVQGGGAYPSMQWGGGVCLWVKGMCTPRGHTHPGRHPLGRHPHSLWRWPLNRVVRILLECILVQDCHCRYRYQNPNCQSDASCHISRCKIPIWYNLNGIYILFCKNSRIIVLRPNVYRNITFLFRSSLTLCSL